MVRESNFAVTLVPPKSAAPAAGFPVIYVLDPHTALATLVDFVRNHEQMFGPVMVVGVGYPAESDRSARRMLDLTPPTDPATLPAFQPGGCGPVGGADAFLHYLEDELKPSLRKEFQLDPSRQALFGHSLGGLFALHVLFTRPQCFDTYVAGSPAVWWGERSLLNRLPAAGAPGRRLLVTVGSLESAVNAEELRSMPADSMPLSEIRNS